jgi:hypothetical protein
VFENKYGEMKTDDRISKSSLKLMTYKGSETQWFPEL